MRIAVFVPNNERCGVSDYARRLSGAMPSETKASIIPLPTGKSRYGWRDVARRANDCDVAWIHYEYKLFDPVKPYRNRFALFMRALDVPSVVTLHSPLPTLQPRWNQKSGFSIKDTLRDLAYLPFFSKWDRSLCSLGSRFVCHCEEVAQRMGAFVPSERVSCLPMPVPSTGERWSQSSCSPRTLVTPGFVKAHKGYESLLEVLVREPELKWIIAGGPQDDLDLDYLSRLKREIDDKGLFHRVEITGYIETAQIEDHLSRAALALFPYQWTSGSAAVAWAIGVGTPVLTSDLGCFRSLEKAGAGLSVLPKDDPERWADVVNDLLNDNVRLAELNRKNQEYASKYNDAYVAKRMTEIFKQVSRNENRWQQVK